MRKAGIIAVALASLLVAGCDPSDEVHRGDGTKVVKALTELCRGDLRDYTVMYGQSQTHGGVGRCADGQIVEVE